jgi:cullin-associated NEDD8-dissociated protein 1
LCPQFGRTLTSNGKGTDHGWAGNQIVLGGNVNGSRIHGHFPPRLSVADNPLLVGGTRARFIPTTPWEGLWQPIAQWFGVAAANMPTVMPNAANFPTQLLDAEQVFLSA